MIQAQQHDPVDRVLGVTEQYGLLNHWHDLRDSVHPGKLCAKSSALGQGLILNVARHLDVRPEPNNFVLNLSTESPNNGEREEKRRDPQRNAANCDVGNESQETAALVLSLGPPQIPKGHEALEVE
jgi:hypothetical protein